MISSKPWAKRLGRGWCLGTSEFKKGLLERMHGHLGPNHSGAMRQEAKASGGEKVTIRS
jgi:hypothetical protein